MAFDYARGNKDLKKKRVDHYCNKLLENAHDGLTLEHFLRVNFLTRSAWDKYVKKHPQIRVALQDARERARGFMFEQLYSRGLTTSLINPQLMKVLLATVGGYTDKTGEEVNDAPAPSFTFVQGSPPKRGPNHPANMGSVQQHIVQETGELAPGGGGNGSNGGGGNGKSNGGNGSNG